MKNINMKNLVLIIIPLLLISCANIRIVEKNISILKRNIQVASMVVDAHEKMLSGSYNTSIIIYPSSLNFDEKNTVIYLGNSTLDIVIRNKEIFNKSKNDTCMVFYNIVIKSNYNAVPCFEISDLIQIILSNKRNIFRNKISIGANRRAISGNRINIEKNRNDIIKLEKAIDFNVGATLETFKLSATVSNVTVAQNVFFEDVRREAKELDARIARMETTQNGFHAAVRSQLVTMGIKVDQLVSVANEIRN